MTDDRLTQKDWEQIQKRVGEDRITTKDIEVQRNIKKSKVPVNKARKLHRMKYILADQMKGGDRLTQKDVEAAGKKIEEAGGFNKGGMADYIKDLL